MCCVNSSNILIRIHLRVPELGIQPQGSCQYPVWKATQRLLFIFLFAPAPPVVSIDCNGANYNKLQCLKFVMAIRPMANFFKDTSRSTWKCI